MEEKFQEIIYSEIKASNFLPVLFSPKSKEKSATVDSNHWNSNLDGRKPENHQIQRWNTDTQCY